MIGFDDGHDLHLQPDPVADPRQVPSQCIQAHYGPTTQWVLPSNCGNNPRRRDLDETGLAQIDRFEPFARHEISSLRRQLPHHRGVGEQRPRGGPLACQFRAEDGFARAHQRQDFFLARQTQRHHFAAAGGTAGCVGAAGEMDGAAGLGAAGGATEVGAGIAGA